jgi:hypothetical protein
MALIKPYKVKFGFVILSKTTKINPLNPKKSPNHLVLFSPKKAVMIGCAPKIIANIPGDMC